MLHVMLREQPVSYNEENVFESVYVVAIVL